MKRIAFAALAAASLMLSACGGGNANCKDDEAAMAYITKWQTDLTTAMASGKVDPTKGQEAGTELANAMGNMKDRDDVCNKLDDIRKRIGF